MRNETSSGRLPLAPALAVLALRGTAAAQAQILSPNLIYTAVQPCRVFDTRSSSAGALTTGTTQTFNVVGNTTGTYFTGQGGTNGGCAIPGFDSTLSPRVQAVVLNLVAITPSGAGDLVAWPTDQSQPGSSVINYSSGVTVANAIVIPVRQDSQGGDISLRAQVSNTNALGDVLGFFSVDSPQPSSSAYGGNLFLGGKAGNIASFTGVGNVGFGDGVLGVLTSGSYNTASGWEALFNLTTGGHNAALGAQSLYDLTTGSENVAVGAGALDALGTGVANIAIGYFAGDLLSGADGNNIEIGNSGASGDNSVIRIGFNQTSTFVAGINGATSSSGTAVYVNSNGQLGTTTSSLRFKEDVEDMGGASDGLMQLRPITFHYKPQFDDGSHLLQYGLAAEEVAKVNPELVQYDGGGKPLAVRYHFINAMMLNEVQHQHRTIERQEAQLAAQQAQLEEQRAEIAELQRQVRALLAR